MTWSRLLPGAALLLAVLGALNKSGGALLHGHWSYPVLLAAAAIFGAVLIAWGLRGAKPQPGRGRMLGRWAAALAGVGLAALCTWLAPYPAIAQPAIATQQSGSGIWMGPQEAPVGIAFIPGALVDPRAYENIFAPLAEAGYPVYIAKPPLSLAFGVPDVIGQARQAVPGVQEWVVAGHSLGGAVASGQTEGAAGLILLAAFPIEDISGQSVPVLSISATNDLLATPEDIADSRTTLPPDTEFVAVDGGIHAYFGDYGPQQGDGEATISREQQQEQTLLAIEEFLAQVAPPGP